MSGRLKFWTDEAQEAAAARLKIECTWESAKSRAMCKTEHKKKITEDLGPVWLSL